MAVERLEKCRTLIRRNDLVQVIAGGDSGRKTRPPEGMRGGRALGVRARVRSVDRATGRAIVDGVNIVKKAVRPDPRKGHRGGIVEKNALVELSNLMLVCRKCDRPTRARLERERRKIKRLCRRCGAEI